MKTLALILLACGLSFTAPQAQARWHHHYMYYHHRGYYTRPGIGFGITVPMSYTTPGVRSRSTTVITRSRFGNDRFDNSNLRMRDLRMHNNLRMRGDLRGRTVISRSVTIRNRNMRFSRLNRER